jgi:hypothetical protein
MRSIHVGDGKICRHCHTQMRRFEHPQEWQPKPRQRYFFLWWDICPVADGGCGRIFQYEEAKRSSWRRTGYIEA